MVAYRELAFIDHRVSDEPTLVEGLWSDVEAIIFPDTGSALGEMARAFHGRTDLRAIRVIAHCCPDGPLSAAEVGVVGGNSVFSNGSTVSLRPTGYLKVLVGACELGGTGL